MARSSQGLKHMIFIGVGANLPTNLFPSPLETCRAALDAINTLSAVRVMAQSRWFKSAPVPVSEQPWFINGVARLETDLSPIELLRVLHTVEADFGRVRTRRNAPRVLDLDLLAFHALKISNADVEIPHPRLHHRAFVLLPLADLAPDWIHPVTGETLADLVANLPKDQVCRPLNEVNVK